MKRIITGWSKAHQDGGAWVRRHQLRHDIFIDRLHYDVQSSNSMEFDQFDTPNAVYIVVMNEADDKALACCRIVPTSAPTMVKTLWPELLATFDLSRTTHIGVRHELPSTVRQAALNCLIQTTLEFTSRGGGIGIQGVMPQTLFRSVLRRNG
nr:acyl-homoserine-lactone synthase [uncultured Cohaesibacter sp.]